MTTIAIGRRSLSPRGAVTLRAAAVVAAIVGAYHYSLLTLLRGLTLDSPLAYLGLVPLVAFVLALSLAPARPSEPDIHDRYVDYIVGMPLLLAAVAVVIIVPIATSTFFWAWRVDLLALPLFAAGAVAIIFGMRTLWRIRVAIAFLLLAWPPPYLVLVNEWLQTFTDLTIAALRVAVSVLPVAQPSDVGDGSLFLITHQGAPFLVSVASACAGVNGMVGFLLVALAFLAIVRGPLGLKAAWLGLGLALTWGLNLGRILIIFWAGTAWGETVAIGGLHPFIGLVTFNIGVLGMLLGMPLFRLRLGLPGRLAPRAAGVAAVRPLAARRALRSGAVALTIVLLATGAAGYANAGMREFERLAHDLGPTRLIAGSAATAIDGWALRRTATYPWVTRYFGDSAGWDRYEYLSASDDGGGQRRLNAVTLDLISTADLGTFSTYGLEACYRFHNYRILDARRIDLGAGVIGQSVVYYNSSAGATWTAVFWEWPVRVASGERYERLVLNTTSLGPSDVDGPRLSNPIDRLRLIAADAFLGSSRAQLEPDAERTRDFLVSFAARIVSATAESTQRAASVR